MDVHLSPEVEKKLSDLVAQTGREADDLMDAALRMYADSRAELRVMLNRRYEELKSGKAQPVDGEEVFARLKSKYRSMMKSEYEAV